MSDGGVVTWLVPLTGNQLNLQKALKLFADCTTHEDKVCLRYAAEGAMASYTSVRMAAESDVTYLRGLLQIVHRERCEIGVSDRVVGVGRDGLPLQHVVSLKGQEACIAAVTGHIEVRDQNGRLVPPPPMPARTREDEARELAAEVRTRGPQNSYVARVVKLAASNLAWTKLFVMFEIVQRRGGIDPDWMSVKQQDLFTRTANDFEVLEAESRHGPAKEKRDPSRKSNKSGYVPMSHEEASTAILRLVEQWLQSPAAKRST